MARGGNRNRNRHTTRAPFDALASSFHCLLEIPATLRGRRAGVSRWRRMPAIDFLGWQQTTRKVDWKPASFARSLSRFRSLGFSLSVLALGWICCKLFSTLWQRKWQGDSCSTSTATNCSPSEHPKRNSLGISSHGFLFLLLLLLRRTPFSA